jgi:hypothetical protein
MDKYNEITNDCNYDSSCMLTSLPVLDLNTSFLMHRVHNMAVPGRRGQDVTLAFSKELMFLIYVKNHHEKF